MTITSLASSIGRRIYGLISRGTIKNVDNTKSRQIVQIGVHDDEVRPDVESWQSYGFASAPKPGAEHIVASVGGDTAHSVVLCIDDRRYRIKSLVEGEVAIYDDLGQTITLKRDRIEVKGPLVVVDSDDVRLSSAAAAAGIVCAGVAWVCPAAGPFGHLSGSSKVKGAM